MTKKFLLTILVAIYLGSFLGNFLFEKYMLEDEIVMRESNAINFIYEGTYSSSEQAVNSSKDIDNKLIVKEDANYIVYLAITNNDNNLEKLKEIYSNKNIKINVKKMSVNNNTFLATLEQLDLLVNNTDVENEILNIEDTILANYEETLRK